MTKIDARTKAIPHGMTAMIPGCIFPASGSILANATPTADKVTTIATRNVRTHASQTDFHRSGMLTPTDDPSSRIRLPNSQRIMLL